ncbi:VRR-NUC domain-containing protein [Bombardia bombarda]|uniref:Fanconi-associated nuclease n=1 Tax=Bombardia bombarda TaxID=252184 RepID=A0AA39WB07_9PEZI|nr:VRR-NUC domain-containing protein [Bombardia bombarda]
MDQFILRSRVRSSNTQREGVLATAGPANSNNRKPERPPAKKRRVEEVKATDNDDDAASSTVSSNEEEDGEERVLSTTHDQSSYVVSSPGIAEDTNNAREEVSPAAQHHTALEDSLPAIRIDKEAIEEYEAMRASQASQPEWDEAQDTAARIESRQWVRGKSSIYVDAFNLALDTVLKDEAHLFDDNEKCVFEHWRDLSYESQYLYVRLFLRKTASWHRVERLKHYNDVSDMSSAIESLLEARKLPLTESADFLVQESPARDVSDLLSMEESFTFADDSNTFIKTIEEAASLLGLDELKMLAKEAKVQRKNKPELLKAFCRMSARQTGLMSLGLRRSSTNGSVGSMESPQSRDESPEKQDSNRNAHYLAKILAITGPLVRLSEPAFKLFERVHLVFYRSTEWTEKSLTTIILAKMSRRNFPQYIVCRSANIYPSRRHLLEFENSMRRDFEVDKVLEFNGPPGEEGFNKVLDIFERISSRWRELLREEQHREDSIYEIGEGAYLRRFNAAHAYTRIAHKAAYVLGRLHKYKEEYELLTELLQQRLFHPARRGSWYQRKALLEEHYMWEIDPGPVSANPEMQKKHWWRVAATTCETALEDHDCHLIYHYDLQKRLLKLEKRLRIPHRLQHDFGHVKLREPEEQTAHGIQLVRDDDDPAGVKSKTGRGLSTKTIWLDELGDPGEDGQHLHVSVEEMCLSHYRSQGWKGYHSEGGILRTLFAYLFYDVLFVYIPNVFQTAFQTCPLDLHTDAFYPARASEINHRLVEIANGGAERLLREVNDRERDRRTCVVGLKWDFEIEDLLELVACFDGEALAAVCKVMAQDYRARGGGVPDLVLWRMNEGEGGNIKPSKGEVLFAEVKSANDRLSDTQRLWIHVLTGSGVRVALCNAVAKEVRTIG